jgi:uncharacterized protein YjbI with pentapeptide repeats
VNAETDPGGSIPAPLDGDPPTDPTISAAELNGKHYFRERFEHYVFGPGLNDVRFDHCSFSGAKFSGLLNHVRFVHCTFDEASFEEAILLDCDLRYARFEWTSFARAEICGSDMYRCAFRKGVVFEGAHIWGTSLHLADLSGSDLRWANFCPPAHKRGPPLGHSCRAAEKSARLAREAFLVQEADEDEFRRFLAQAAAFSGGNEFTTWVSEPMLVVRRWEDGSLIYRRLAGRCAVAGQYRDESQAYVRAKHLERNFALACANREVEDLDRARLDDRSVALLYLRLLLHRLKDWRDRTGEAGSPSGPDLTAEEFDSLRLHALKDRAVRLKRCDPETLRDDLAKVEDDHGPFRHLDDREDDFTARLSNLELASLELEWLLTLDLERAKQDIIDDDLDTWGREKYAPRRSAWLRTRSRAFGLHVVEWITGYAESIWRVVLTLAVVVLGTAGVLRLSHGLLRDATLRTSVKPASLLQCLEAAFGNLAAQVPNHTHYGAGLIPVLVASETLTGVAAVGLLGFMLANRLRHA